MKKKLQATKCFALISIFSLLFVSCSQGPVDVTEQIKEANKDLESAVMNGDAEALAGFYTADARLFPANSAIIEGRDAIAGFWAATFNMGIKKVLFETVVAQKFGDIAIEEGNYKLFVDGDILVDQGKYIVSWKNEGGKWMIFKDIWNNSAPPEQVMAVENDSVLIVLNHVKPDKVEAFEDFYQNYLSPAGAEFNPQAKKMVRLQKPAGQNKDGTFTYIFFIDPYRASNNYDMMFPLAAKYGEEQANEYMNMYIDCLKDGKSQAFLEVETKW